MELTITENGALYGMQHRPLREFHGRHRKQSVANKLIRTNKRRSEMLADRNIILGALIFLFGWSKLKLHI